MWARIADGAVAELTDLDPAGRYVASLVWVSCAADVKPGYVATEVNGAWSFAAPGPLVASQQMPLRDQLTTLDLSIPRGLEDSWAASNFDTTRLPQMTQDKFTEKHALRARLAALITAGTP